MIHNTTLFDNKSTQELIHADTTKGIYVTWYSNTSTYYYIYQDHWCLGEYITFNKGMPKKIYILDLVNIFS